MLVKDIMEKLETLPNKNLEIVIEDPGHDLPCDYGDKGQGEGSDLELIPVFDDGDARWSKEGWEYCFNGQYHRPFPGYNAVMIRKGMDDVKLKELRKRKEWEQEEDEED